MKIFKKAVLPRGFQANGLASGIKKSGKLDLALFYSVIPAKAAALFTSNKIQAAPILVSKRHLEKSQDFQAIIANSGNANCFSGKKGLLDAEATVGFLAKVLKIKKTNILVASTGIIGKTLPEEKIQQAIPELVRGLSREGINKAQSAILTTDTFTKSCTLKYKLAGKDITLCAVAKGVGMIAPNLATMLAFIFSDAQITSTALKSALKIAVDNSFNCVTVDGCMSTNDTVAIMANGLAGNNPIGLKKNFSAFSRALNLLCRKLAQMLIQDAEGATKFITVKVNGAKNSAQAKRAALFIANSNLFKTAVYGENPNFGRIIAAIGASGILVRAEKLKIKASALDKREVVVEAALNIGRGSAVVYTSDLTPEYIKINAGYN